MRTQSRDTNPEIERVQIELIRQAPITKRFALIEELTAFLIEAAKEQIRRDHPDTNETEVALLLLTRQYGEVLADKVRQSLERR